MSVEFVEATEKGQIELLAGLAREIWTDHFGPMFEKETLDTVIEKVQSAKAIMKQIEEGYLYYFIQFQGASAGYLAYRINAAESELFLSKLYLLSSMRRQGLGRLVMQHLEEICRIRHLSGLRLTVFHKNTSAIKAYEMYGFQNLGSIRRYLGNGIVIHDYEMGKTILRSYPGSC